MGISFFFRPSLTTGRTLRGPDCPGNQQGTQGRRSPSIAARTNRPQHTGSLAKGTRKHKERARKARGRRLQSSAEKLQRHSRSVQATSSRTAPARRALAFLSCHRQKAASAHCRPRRDGADKKSGRRHGFSTVRARAFPRNRGGRRGRQARTLPRNRSGRRGHKKRPLRVAEGSLFLGRAPRAPCLSSRCRAGPIARRTPSEL